jgi:hypothetical protein
MRVHICACNSEMANQSSKIDLLVPVVPDLQRYRTTRTRLHKFSVVNVADAAPYIDWLTLFTPTPSVDGSATKPLLIQLVL